MRFSKDETNGDLWNETPPEEAELSPAILLDDGDLVRRRDVVVRPMDYIDVIGADVEYRRDDLERTVYFETTAHKGIM